MIGLLVRKFSTTFYKYPQAPDIENLKGEFSSLKIAIIADYLTETCLKYECRIRNITPDNYQDVLQNWKPDFLFVESAFHGFNGSWRYELAKQPFIMRFTKPTIIKQVLLFAKSRGIPTVFWNKDDDVYFNSFIDIAKLFDHVFTADTNCVPRYRAEIPSSATVNTLMMPYQPALHWFNNFSFSINKPCFTGSYYRKILDCRRVYMDMLFNAALETKVDIDVYDRNSDRFSRFVEFRYPKCKAVNVKSRVPHNQTGQLYKSYVLSINVNSITNSETMCSRRLLEIIACGGIAMTNPSLCIAKYFTPYCHVVAGADEAIELFNRLRYGPNSSDLERAASGAKYVRANHTWSHRIQEICEVAKI